MEVDVTRVSFEFSDLESSVRENIEADSFWCMTKVIVIYHSGPTIQHALVTRDPSLEKLCNLKIFGYYL